MKIGYTKSGHTIYKGSKGGHYIRKIDQQTGKMKRRYIKKTPYKSAKKTKKTTSSTYLLDDILEKLIFPIGEGSYGQVYNIQHPYDDKVLKISKFNTKQDKKIFKNELKILQYLDNDVESAVTLYAYAIRPNVGYLLMEQLDSTPNPKRRQKYVAKSLYFDALKEIHKKGVVHNDIKFPNIMYRNGKPVFIDFGKSEIVDDKTLFDEEIKELEKLF